MNYFPQLPWHRTELPVFIYSNIDVDETFCWCVTEGVMKSPIISHTDTWRMAMDLLPPEARQSPSRPPSRPPGSLPLWHPAAVWISPSLLLGLTRGSSPWMMWAMTERTCWTSSFVCYLIYMLNWKLKALAKLLYFILTCAQRRGVGVVPFNVFPFLTIFGLNMFL